jgi:hypothetical protein
MNVQPLSYDTPLQPKPTRALYTIALACGLLPLGVGTIIFLLFLLIRSPILAAFGFLTILGGTCLAVVGFACAAVYLFQAKHAAPEEADRARRDAHKVFALIIADFLAAFAMAWIGISLMPMMD